MSKIFQDKQADSTSNRRTMVITIGPITIDKQTGRPTDRRQKVITINLCGKPTMVLRGVVCETFN